MVYEDVSKENKIKLIELGGNCQQSIILEHGKNGKYARVCERLTIIQLLFIVISKTLICCVVVSVRTIQRDSYFRFHKISKLAK